MRGKFTDQYWLIWCNSDVRIKVTEGLRCQFGKNGECCWLERSPEHGALAFVKGYVRSRRGRVPGLTCRKNDIVGGWCAADRETTRQPLRTVLRNRATEDFAVIAPRSELHNGVHILHISEEDEARILAILKDDGSSSSSSSSENEESEQE